MHTPALAVRRTALVAVYGTLKRGLRNHHWLAGADFVGEDVIDTVTLYDLGPYPGPRPNLPRVWRSNCFASTQPA